MKKNHFENLIMNNPVLVKSFGLVPVLAVTKTLKEALIMAVSVIIVMILSSVFVSILKKFIPEEFENVTVLSIIAAFSILIVLLVERLLPDVAVSIGIFLPLIAVNSLIFWRVKTYAIVESVNNAFLDAFTNALGFGLVMIEIGIIREFFGKGSIFGLQILPLDFIIPIFSEPTMALIIVGLYFAGSDWYTRQRKLKEARK